MTITPTVHLNGTDAEDLLKHILGATEAIRHAETALGRTAPNARDYYTQGGQAYAIAAREHTARVVSLRQIKADLEEIAASIDAQMDEREGRRRLL